MPTSLEVASTIDKLLINGGRWDSIVNGSDTTIVGTDGGPVPSVANFFRQMSDLNDGIYGLTLAAKAAAEMARDDAEQYASDADAARMAAQTAQALADAARTQATNAAIAAGAKFVADTTAGLAATVDGEMFLIHSGPGTQIWDNVSGTAVFFDWLGDCRFDDVAALFAFTGTILPGTTVLVSKEQLSFIVVATGEDVVTPNGLKLFVPELSVGGLSAVAFGLTLAVTTAERTGAIQTMINRGSHRGITKFWFPSGRFIVNTIRLFYDATLNPGFNNASPPRQARCIFAGTGALSVGQLVNYDPYYGSTLEFAVGHWLKVAGNSEGHGVSPYPARRFIAQDIAFVAQTAAAPVIEMASCPFFHFDRCSILQTHADGDGVDAPSSWYGGFWKTNVLNNSASTTKTGRGVKTGNAISASLYLIGGQSLIDGFRDNLVWTGGTWAVFGVADSAIQAAQRYSVVAESGLIRKLLITGCHFEGPARVNDLKLNDVVETLDVRDNHFLAGLGDGSRYVSDCIIDALEVDLVNVSDNTIYRVAQPFLRIGTVKNGKSPGIAERNSFRTDADAFITGPVYLYEGVLPKIADNVWPNFGQGVEASMPFRLYDTSGANFPAVLEDKQNGVVTVSRMSFGPWRVLTGIAASVLQTSVADGSNYDITNTVNHQFRLPGGAAAADGRIFVVRNNPASAGTTNVATSSGVVIRALSPGQTAMFIYNKALGTYFSLLGA